MKPEEILEKAGVLKKGHFLLSSGNHSDIYFEKYKILSDPHLLGEYLKFADDFIKKLEFDVFMGPFTGGAIIASILGFLKNKKAIYLEKKEHGFIIRRDFGIKFPFKGVIVDDVITTGGSILKSIEAAVKKNIEIKGILVLIDRREKEENFSYPFYAIYKKRVRIYPPDKCPLCRENIPLQKPGGQ